MANVQGGGHFPGAFVRGAFVSGAIGRIPYRPRGLKIEPLVVLTLFHKFTTFVSRGYFLID